MQLRNLKLHNFRGYYKNEFNFSGYSALIGPNGIGKTTILDAISLCCSSLDFFGNALDIVKPPVLKCDTVEDVAATTSDWVPDVTADARLKAFLKKNIRMGENNFRVVGVFEHEGKELVVDVSENGFARNDLIRQPFWWGGICYFARFDTEMTHFQLRVDLWDRFQAAYEGITGFTIEPEIMTESELEDIGENGDMVVGFWVNKPEVLGRPAARIHCRMCSAGEKKIAKSLSQIVNIQKQPHIVLVDNIEMHVHYKRHITMIDEMKSLFFGKQIISTTHSVMIMNQYEPKSDLCDIETLLEKQANGQFPGPAATPTAARA